MGEDTPRREGAQTLAERIRCFWIERGYASPSIVVEKIERLDKTFDPIFVIRSDMRGGLPRGGR
jgi:hypothetical protein